jgi:anti-repressor protein
MQNTIDQIVGGEFSVRFVGTDEPKFVGRDVCDALGYKNANRTMNLHCKGVPEWYTLDTPGGAQSLRIISEADMMRLICASKLPSAEKFERWVFEEVLPSIRKHGAYIAPKTLEQLIDSPDFGMALFKKLKDEQEKYNNLRLQHEETKAEVAKLTNDLLKKDSEVVELRKHSDFSMRFRQSSDLMLVRHFAALMSEAFDIKFGQKAAFQWLIKNKYMTKDHFPSAYALKHKLLWVAPGTREHRDGSTAITYVTKVTPKGCGYFYDKLHDELSIDDENK